MTSEHRPNVTYATRDGATLAGDLYLPKGAGPHPALVAVHGGGWQQGARSAFVHWGEYLAARGYAVFAVSYSLAKKGRITFPAAVEDVRAAVAFVRGKAAEFNVDPARIALFGASAGAQIAALAALAGGSPRFAHNTLADGVKALIGVYGVYDMVAMWEKYQLISPRDNNIENFLGCAPYDDPQLYFDASPISHATAANNAIAVFLAVGSEDDLVDRRLHTDAFRHALQRAGFFVRTAIVQGAPHYWLSDPIDEPGSYTGFLAPRLIRFLAEKL